MFTSERSVNVVQHSDCNCLFFLLLDIVSSVSSEAFCFSLPSLSLSQRIYERSLARAMYDYHVRVTIRRTTTEGEC